MKNKRFLIFLAVTISLIIVDQVVKHIARTAGAWTDERAIGVLLPGIVEFKLVFNKGIAFGMMKGFAVFMTPVAIAMAIGAGVYSFRKPEERTFAHVTAGLLAAGAVGNLIDRLWLGKVTDMIWLKFINFAVFNVADMCITFAGAFLVWGALVDMIKGEQKAEQPKIADNPN